MRVAVVGGGIAGLAAAYELADEADVTVFESTDRVGGKLRLEQVGDLALDVGAEAMLARRPEARDLCVRAGLDALLVDVASTQASVWTHGALHPMPRTVMGIPAEPVDFVRVEHHSIAVPEYDISVADYVSSRAGHDVLDRLVEPVLGGVYAGRTEDLSLNAAAEQLRALGDDPVGSAAAAAPPPGPVFFGLAGGVGRLPQALASALDVRTDSVVRQIERDGAIWRVACADASEQFDAVVVATPAPAAARLLADVAPRAAFELADIAYASVVIVTFVFDRELELPGSGFLVPAVDGKSIKAATFSSNKWEWVAQTGRTVVRASLGRAGEAAVLQYDDATLAEVALADLREALGSLPQPDAWHVQRWGGGLPQYAVGHRERVDRIESDVAPVRGLAVCGAAYRGIGIPAVIASAQGAVDGLRADLGD